MNEPSIMTMGADRAAIEALRLIRIISHSGCLTASRAEHPNYPRVTAGFDRFEPRTAVVAGLVPATPNFKARSKNNRGGRDKPGHDARGTPSASTSPEFPAFLTRQD